VEVSLQETKVNKASRCDALSRQLMPPDMDRQHAESNRGTRPGYKQKAEKGPMKAVVSYKAHSTVLLPGGGVVNDVLPPR